MSDELRRLAEAAKRNQDWGRAVAKMGRRTINGQMADAVNPDAVLALLDRLAAAEAAVERVRAIAWCENATAILWGVIGSTPETYSGVSKDDALDAAGDLVNDLRAALRPAARETPPLDGTAEGETTGEGGGA